MHRAASGSSSTRRRFARTSGDSWSGVLPLQLARLRSLRAASTRIHRICQRTHLDPREHNEQRHKEAERRSHSEMGSSTYMLDRCSGSNRAGGGEQQHGLVGLNGTQLATWLHFLRPKIARGYIVIHLILVVKRHNLCVPPEFNLIFHDAVAPPFSHTSRYATNADGALALAAAWWPLGTRCAIQRHHHRLILLSTSLLTYYTLVTPGYDGRKALLSIDRHHGHGAEEEVLGRARALPQAREYRCVRT